MGYQYTSVWGAIRTILAQEGFKGLYKGLGPNLLKVAPSMAANWLSFEMAKDFFLGLGSAEPI
jgi:solute carrier family 25 (mitochondrial phosphate transporter), member 23/24/25/41